MGTREAGSFVRIRLSIRYALREFNNDLVSAWKLLYGFNLDELPTVKSVVSDVRKRLDLGSWELGVFSKGYEVPIWCSSQVFEWDDELDIWIVPSRDLAKRQRSVNFSSAKLASADSSAEVCENEEEPFTTGRVSKNKKKESVAKQKPSVGPTENDRKRAALKRSLAKSYNGVTDGQVEPVERTESPNGRRHFSRTSRDVGKVAKREDPRNPGHFYFLSDSDASETESEDKKTSRHSFSKDGEAKELKLTGRETVKDLSKIALLYGMPKKKKKKMLKQQGAVEQSNVSFVFQRVPSYDSISSGNGRSTELQESSNLTLEDNVEGRIRQEGLTSQNNVHEDSSQQTVDQQPPSDAAQLAPLNPLDLKTAMKIQFKILELNDQLESYLSDWKQAEVVFYNPLTKEVMLKGFSQRTPVMFDVQQDSDTDSSEVKNKALTLISWNLLYEPRIAGQ